MKALAKRYKSQSVLIAGFLILTTLGALAFGLRNHLMTAAQAETVGMVQPAAAAAPAMMMLGPGSLMFTHVNSDATEGFSIVATAPIMSGTIVFATDHEWGGASFDNDGSDEVYTITFTSDAPCGTEFTFTDGVDPTSNNGSTLTIDDNSFVDLEAAGDAIYLFDGSLATPNFIAAISFGTGSWGSNGNLPATLTNDINALDFGDDNGEYICGEGSLAGTIMDQDFWNTDGAAITHTVCSWNCNPPALSPGDILFTHANSDDPDGWTFVTTTDIPMGTVVTITENEWDGSAFNTGEETYTVTFTSDAVCGTEVAFQETLAPTSNNGSTVTISDNTYEFATGGEELYLYTSGGSLSGLAQNFVTAIRFAGNFGGAALTNTGLTNGTTAIDIDADNGEYLCASGNLPFELTTLMDDGNWTISNGTVAVLNSFCTWNCSGADVEIVKPDGSYCGDMITLKIFVVNNGPEDDMVNVVDDFPGTWTNIMWSSSLLGVPVTMGMGDINDNYMMEAGDTIIYTVMADLPANTSGTIMNTATVTGTDDYDLTNNSSTGDYTEYEFVCNPPLETVSCDEFRILLVLDASPSITGDEITSVQDAAAALVDALVNTGAQLAVVQFDADATNASINASTDYQVITPAYVTAFNAYMTSSYPQNGEAGTNWEDAFIKALSLEPASLMLFMTDGDPTAYNAASAADCPGGGCNHVVGSAACISGPNGPCEATALSRAITQANIVKSEGTHLYVIAVSEDTPPDLANIIDISGPVEDLCPDDDVVCRASNPTDPDFELADFTEVSFAELALDLVNFTGSACQSDIQILKTVYEGHNSGAGCPGLELVTAPDNTNITYCFTITNIGDDILDFVEFADPLLGIIETDPDNLVFVELLSGAWPLNPDDVVTYYYETTVDGDLCNTASITAQGQISLQEVMDDDDACVESDGGVICGPCNISGPVTLCPSAMQGFRVTVSNCLTPVYTWMASNGASILNGQGTDTITVMAPAGCNTAFVVSVSIACEGCEVGTTPVICQQIVTTQDSEDPVFTNCDAGDFLGCNPDPSEYAADDFPSWTDNCGTPLSDVVVGVPVSNGCARSVVHKYWATDACLNSDTCYQVFTWIEDTTPPETTNCDSGGDLGCNPDPSEYAADDAPTWTDECGTPIAGMLAGTPVNTSGCAWSVTHRYWATDCENTSDTCYQTFTWIEDSTPPMTTNCDLGGDLDCNPDPSEYAADDAPTWTDICGVTNSGVVTGTPANTAGCSWSVTHKYWAVDACQTSDTCYQTFTWIEDTAPPMTTNCDPGGDLGCNPLTPSLYEANDFPTWTDECGVTNSGVVPGTPTNVGCAWSVTHRYWATDACQTSDTCYQTFTWIEDTTPPETTNCDSGGDLMCNPDPAEYAADDAPTWTDICGVTNSGVVTGTPTNTTGCSWSVTHKYWAVDACQTSDTCYQTFTWVEDTAPPTVTCPQDYSLEWPPIFNMEPVPPGQPQDPVITPVPPLGFPIIGDNCGIQNVMFADTLYGPDPLSCPVLWFVERTWKVTDVCGNMTICVQVISFTDVTPPVINCPPPASYECMSQVPPPSDGLNQATATDNCGTPTITFVGETMSTGACPRVIIRKYKATDNCMNMATCTQTITVSDNTPPMITNVQDPPTVECIDDIVFVDPLASDNCELASFTYSDMSGHYISETLDGLQEVPPAATPGTGTLFAIYDTTTNMLFVDLAFSGLIGTTTNAHLHGPAPAGVNAGVLIGFIPTGFPLGVTSGSYQAMLALTEAQEDMLLAGLTYVNVHTTFLPGGEIRAQLNPNCKVVKRTWIATDACGNTASASAVAVTNDVTPPAPLVCPADVDLGCNPTFPDDLPPPAVLTTVDNCDGVITAELLPSDVVIFGCNATLVRYYRATDCCGNSVSCSQVITWTVDTTPPSLACSDFPFEDFGECRTGTLPPAPGVEVSDDNCSGSVGQFYNGRYYSLTAPGTWDEARTEAIAAGGELVAINDEDENAFLYGAFALNETVWIGFNDVSSEGFFEWSNGDAVTYTNWAGGEPNDAGGEDHTEMSGGGFGQWNDTNGSNVRRGIIETTVPFDIVVVVDTLRLDTLSACDGSVTYRYTVADACDNVATCTQVVLYTIDLLPPVISECEDITIYDPDHYCLDLSDLEDLIEHLEDHAEDGDFAYPVDDCGIEDFDADAFFHADLPDGCGLVIRVLYFAEDECGSTSSCTQLITLIDIAAPVLSAPEDVTVECADGNLAGVPTVSDPCFEEDFNTYVTYVDLDCVVDVQDFTGTYDVANWTANTQGGGMVVPTGNVSVTITGADDPGCVAGATNSYSIVVPADGKIVFNWSHDTDETQDDWFGYSINGVFVPLTNDDEEENTQSGRGAALVSSGDVFAFEARSFECTPGAGVAVVSDFEVYTCIPHVPQPGCTAYDFFRCWSATDICGHTAYALQRITVNDNIPPKIFCSGGIAFALYPWINGEEEDELDIALYNIGLNAASVEITSAQFLPIDLNTQFERQFGFDRNPVTGLIYLIATPLGQPYQVDRRLYELDITTGSTTEIGQLIPASSSGQPIDLSFDGAGNLYVVFSDGSLDLVDVNTAQTTNVATLPGGLGEFGLTYDFDSNRLIYANGSDPVSIMEITLPGFAVNSLFSVFVSSENNSTCGMQAIEYVGNGLCIASNTFSCDVVFEVNLTTETASVLLDPSGSFSNIKDFLFIGNSFVDSFECTGLIVGPDPELSGYPLAFDACAEPILSYSDEIVPGASPCFYTVIRTWTAEDECGNVATSCDQLITLEDTTPPTITCPGPAIVECGVAPDTMLTGSATAADLCDSDPFVTYSDLFTPGGCATGTGTIVRTWRAEDACGNSVSCTQLITIVDTTPPTITCPDDFELECAIIRGIFPPPNPQEVMAFDICSGQVMVTWVGDVQQDQECGYRIVRTYRAEDACGNAASCTQIFQVGDTEPPMIDCPGDMTISCDASTDPSNTGEATATDNCVAPELVTITYDDVMVGGSCAQTFIIVRTWRAMDECGNAATCTQHIDVRDTTPPVFGQPDCEGVTGPFCDQAQGTPGFASNPECEASVCAVDPFCCNTEWDGICADEALELCCGCLTPLPPCDQAHGGAGYRLDPACEDAVCANDPFCCETAWDGICASAAATLEECCGCLTTPTCNEDCADITVECGDEIPVITPTVNDNCDSAPEVSYVDGETIPGECPVAYQFVRTWYAEDDCGNVSTCQQTIFVEDTTPPSLTCPEATMDVLTTYSEVPENTLVNGLVLNGVTYTATPVMGVFIGGGPPPQTAIDPPGITGPPTMVITMEFDKPVSMVRYDFALCTPIESDPGSTMELFDADDNSLGVFTGAAELNNPFPFVEGHVTGNVLAVRAVVTFSLVGEPCGAFMDNLVYSCPGSDLGCDPAQLPPPAQLTAVDACVGIVDVTVEVVRDDTVGCVGTLIYKYFASDDCDNTATCTQTYTYNIGGELSMACTKPAPFFCPEELPVPEELAQWLIDEGYASVNADGCGDAEVQFVEFYELNNNCSLGWTFGFSATDACGNSADTCYIIVQIYHDEEAPMITCSDPPHLGCNPQSIPTAQQLITAGFVNAIDGCGPASIGFIPPFIQTNVGCEYSRQYRFRATDGCGNQSEICIVTVNWTVDITPPSLTCPVDLVLECTDVIPAPEVATATDECEVVLVTFVGEVGSGDSCDSLIVRTYYAIDACGNEATCTQQIRILDTTPPAIACPGLVVLECGVDTVPVTSAVVTDNCNSFEVTYSDEEFPQICDGGVLVDGQFKVLTLIVRTFYAVDECDNASSCTQHIIIRDDTPPELSCPADITIECDQDPNDLQLTGVGVAVDLCDPDAYATILVDVPVYTSPCSTVISRVWGATDHCGNGGSAEVCFQTITILDTQAPSITCPDDVTIECGDEIPVELATGTDNCQATVMFTYSDNFASACGVTGVITRTHYAEDECGNVSSCTQRIYIYDTTPPSITCPDDLVLECGTPLPEPMAVATDVCDDDVFVTLVSEEVSVLSSATRAWGFVCTNLQNPQLTPGLYAFDLTDGSATLLGAPNCLGADDLYAAEFVDGTFYALENLNKFLVTLSESGTCNVVGPLAGLTPGHNVSGLSHNPITGITYLLSTSVVETHLYTIDLSNGALTFVGSIPGVEGGITLMISDNGDAYVIDIISDDIFPLNLANATVGAGVQITLNGNPVNLNFAQDADFDCGLNGQIQGMLYLGGGVGFLGTLDPVTGVFVETAFLGAEVCAFSVDCENQGDGCGSVVTRVYRAEDDCGNASTCVQTITIIDTTPPTISCSDDVTIECGEPLPVSMATASDICDEDPFVTMISEFSTQRQDGSCLYYVIRTFRTVDDCGNASSCTQVITVEDTTAPELTCPENYTIDCQELTCLTFDDVTVNPFGAPIDVSVINEGGITINVSAYSKFGIPRTPSLFDTENPHPIEVDMGTPNILYGGPGVSGDNVNGFEASNNQARGKAIIVQQDGVGFPDDHIISDSLVFEFSEPVYLISLVAVDFESPQVAGGAGLTMYDEDGAVLNFVPFAGGPDNNVDDINLQQQGVSKLLVYYGNTTPASGGIANLCFVYVPKNIEEAIVSDNCNAIDVNCNEAVTIVDECITEIVRTFSAIDECGNASASCTQTITIDTDTEKPTIQCPEEVVFECSSQEILIPAPDPGSVVASDNCTATEDLIITWVRDIVDEDDCESVVRRVYSAEDECGNVALCVQYFRIVDTTPPSITCPADATIECGDELPTTLATASDLCNEYELTYSDSEAVGTCPMVVTRTHYATDVCGNTSSCTQYIYIEDTTAPDIDCPNDVTIECGDPLPTTLAFATDICSGSGGGGEGPFCDVPTGTPGFPSNPSCEAAVCAIDPFCCDIAWDGICADEAAEFAECASCLSSASEDILLSYLDSEPIGECPMVITRTHYAEDECGNVASCTQYIFIEDTTAPSITCPEDLTLECGVDPIPTTLATGTDICDDELDFTYVDVEYPQVCDNDVLVSGVDQVLVLIVRTHYATDNCGNVATCTQHILIRDDTPPSVTCVDDITIECDQDPDDYELTGIPTLVDLCDPDAFATLLMPDFPVFTSPCSTVIQRIWIATDHCGNGGSGGLCPQLITIVDTTPPTITCPADATIECGDDLPTTLATGSDNCQDVSFTYSDSAPVGECPMVITRTHYASDGCGNVSSCTQYIYIEDTTAPEISCPAAVTIECGEPLPTSLATALDLCTTDIDYTYSDAGANDDIGGCSWTIARTHYATDNCGNVASCLQIIVIVDTTPPTITCPDDVTIECDEIAGLDVATASDICTEDVFVTLVAEQVNEGTCLYTIVRTYRAEDACGNAVTCTQVITVQDTTPPEVSCPADLTLDCPAATCLTFNEFVVGMDSFLLPTLVQGGITMNITAWSKGGIQRSPGLFNTSTPHPDDLDLGTPNIVYGGPGESNDHPDGYEFANNRPLGNILVVQQHDASYPNDHFLSDSLVITFSEPVFMENVVVMDFEAPSIATGAGIFLFDVDGGLISFTGFAGDGNDNSMEEVVLKKAGVKKMKLYYGTAIPSSGGIGSLCYVYSPCQAEEANASDVCSDVSISCSDTTLIVDECITQIIRTYSAEDECGNVNENACTQVITLETDGLQPEIMCPADLVLDCEDPLPAPDPASVAATDNCTAPEDIVVVWVQDIVMGFGCDEEVRRIYRATDECGNEALCVQFITRQGPPVQLAAKVLLGGSMETGAVDMYTLINNLLPEDQPYYMPPASYPGPEEVNPFPANIVDWVLVELRDVVTMEPIGKRSALVTSTGDIVDLDGVSPLMFTATPDQYYVVICHRNHLDIMSDGPVDMSGSIGTLDFTLGNNGMIQLSSGMWAMIKGDVNSDGLVNNTDLVLLAPKAAIGYSGEYLEFDVNMDGLVNNTDLVILAPFAAVGYAQGF